MEDPVDRKTDRGFGEICEFEGARVKGGTSPTLSAYIPCAIYNRPSQDGMECPSAPNTRRPRAGAGISGPMPGSLRAPCSRRMTQVFRGSWQKTIRRRRPPGSPGLAIALPLRESQSRVGVLNFWRISYPPWRKFGNGAGNRESASSIRSRIGGRLARRKMGRYSAVISRGENRPSP